MPINDLYSDGIASGWKVRNASTFTQDQTIETDIVIIGTGAGGGTAAEILSETGLRVLMVEEGPLKTAADFKDMDESRAYADLYQEGAGRKTADGAIGILQGRSVGGTTTVNWTSSFRTPAATLKRWSDVHGVKGVSEAEMAPWFAKMEARLGIAPWATPPNVNNAALKQAAQKLGWEWHVIPRNVRGCWNTGYCGFGCPVNAKQSMLVSTIPQALRQGAELIHHLRIDQVQHRDGKVLGLAASPLDAACIKPTGVRVQINAKHFIMAGGAINSPALMLRSQVPDPHGRLGKRTFIHPASGTLAQMPERVDGFYGAPQSMASDHFLWPQNEAQRPGFKIEAAPTYTGLTSFFLAAHGSPLAEGMAKLPDTQFMVALIRDGFHEQSGGGQVRVDDDGAPLLDYEMSGYLWEGVRELWLRCAEMQFAIGAKRVRAPHVDAQWAESWSQAKAQIEALSMKKFSATVVTAHLMGGCAMGEDAKQSVVNSQGRHHQLENLHVMDGSLFPTSIGANPQLSIYGLVAKNATALAATLKPVAKAA